MLNQVTQNPKSILWLLMLLMLSACASSPKHVVQKQDLSRWLKEATAYESTLPVGHPDHSKQILSISDGIRTQLEHQFENLHDHRVAQKLAKWLLAPDGLNMKYDVTANFSPTEAVKIQRGNCLSFTILLTTLAAELGVQLEYNKVDIPDVWDMDQDNGMILYRHVNAIRQNFNGKQIFDLAMDQYDARYPQRVISPDEVVALLHSNRAIQALQQGDHEQATHYMKLALSLDQNNPDIFVNLGVMFKRSNRLTLAEEAFLHAFALDSNSSVAASNLERLYQVKNKQMLAKRYAKLARQARLKNPYFQYEKAKEAYTSGDYKEARKSIKRAKRLHDRDSRFFELSSRIEQQLKNYSTALKELEQALKVAKSAEQQERYYSKAKRVAMVMANIAEKNQQRLRNQQTNIILKTSRF